MKQVIGRNRIARFMLAGKAEIVVENTVTQNSRSYKIKRSKTHDNTWYVTGGNMFRLYLGKITCNAQISLVPTNPTTQINSATVSLDFTFTESNSDLSNLRIAASDGFARIWKMIHDNKIPPQLMFYHVGRCCACGRKLTDPISIEEGIGKECKAKYG